MDVDVELDVEVCGVGGDEGHNILERRPQTIISCHMLC